MSDELTITYSDLPDLNGNSIPDVFEYVSIDEKNYLDTTVDDTSINTFTDTENDYYALEDVATMDVASKLNFANYQLYKIGTYTLVTATVVCVYVGLVITERIFKK